MEKIIEVQNLTKKFGNFTAISNISFEVEKGSIFAFLGPNGAGKTTTIKILTTLLKPTEGKVIIAGYDVLKDPDKVRESFGIVFQDSSLDEELTAKENMEFHAFLYNVPKEIRKQRVEDLLKFVELWDKRNVLVKYFSGGMKRRLEIARGLLHHPKIIFLDEPTLGLDPQTRKHIWDYIQDLNKKENLTIFFTTHYIEEAERFSNFVSIIDQGKIIVSGSPSEIKEKAKAQTLEEAFIHFTGHEIRDGLADSLEKMRNHFKRHHR
jgi:ABC-2 type transport system ATP-binding protein